MKKITVDKDILLKPLSLSSAQFIFNSIQSSRNHLRNWLPFVDKTRSVYDTRNFIKSVLHSTCPKKDEIFEIWFEEQFAGLIGLKEIDQANKKVEIGYWLDARMTGKGIMLKTCKALIDFVFLKYKMNRVMIKVAEENERSNRIPLLLGFSLEGVEKDGELIQNRFHNLKVYSMLKRDWKM